MIIFNIRSKLFSNPDVLTPAKKYQKENVEIHKLYHLSDDHHINHSRRIVVIIHEFVEICDFISASRSFLGSYNNNNNNHLSAMANDLQIRKTFRLVLMRIT